MLYFPLGGSAAQRAEARVRPLRGCRRGSVAGPFGFARGLPESPFKVGPRTGGARESDLCLKASIAPCRQGGAAYSRRHDLEHVIAPGRQIEVKPPRQEFASLPIVYRRLG